MSLIQCAWCGEWFEPSGRQAYCCLSCRNKAKWERRKNRRRKRTTPLYRKKEPPAPSTEQCKGCIFWRSLSGTCASTTKACHHYLDTGQRRRHEGDRCFSRQERRRGGEQTKV